MAFSRAGSRATGCTKRGRLYPDYLVAARTLELREVHNGSVPLIEQLVSLVPRSLHLVEDVKTPVYAMKRGKVLVCTDVAHSQAA